MDQCGHSPCAEVAGFKRIKGAWTDASERVVQAAAGLTFSLVLTDTGRGTWPWHWVRKWLADQLVPCSVRVWERAVRPAWERAHGRAHRLGGQVRVRRQGRAWYVSSPTSYLSSHTHAQLSTRENPRR